MKMQIEQWVDERGFPQNITQLFNESFVCYKNGAYRASLVYSYTAFLTIAKNRILMGTKPAAIVQGHWNAVLTELQDDDRWEKKIFTEIVNTHNPLFNTKDYIREQVKYWRDRRNDGAHFKDNPIESFHVEAFWSFIRHNLAKITLEGGRDSLLQKFRDHFDINKTSRGADFTPLVREIDTAVVKAEVKQFVEQLIVDVDGFIGLYDGSNSSQVINAALEMTEAATRELICQYLKEKQLDIYLISEHPEKLPLMSYTPQEIRQLWRIRAFSNGLRESTCKIYSYLLRNGLIPAGDIPEALNLFFDKYTQGSSTYFKSAELHLALSQNNFLELVIRKSVDENMLRWFKWTNSKSSLLSYCLEFYAMDVRLVNGICDASNSAYPPQWLEAAILDLFQRIPAKKIEFTNAANQTGCAIPVVYQ